MSEKYKYNPDTQCVEMYYEDYLEIKREIERLEINYSDAIEDNDRLNNIINELEKWLKEYKIQCKKYDSNSTIVIINGILDKLKELKGE